MTFTAGWPWPQGHAYSRSQNQLQWFVIEPNQVWWKSVESYGHSSQKTYMTFDLEMTLTPRSCLKWQSCKHILYQVWWQLKKQYKYSSQKCKSDPWPPSDLDLWPTQNLNPSDECPNPKTCSYQIWKSYVWKSLRYSCGRRDRARDGCVTGPQSSSHSCSQLRLGIQKICY